MKIHWTIIETFFFNYSNFLAQLNFPTKQKLM